LFTSARSPDELGGPWSKLEISREYPNDAVPPYLIKAGQLYLLVQVTHEGSFITTYIDDDGKWDAMRVASLRRLHPDFAAALPNPSKPNGGISWIK
jgi:hypothetical protein